MGQLGERMQAGDKRTAIVIRTHHVTQELLDFAAACAAGGTYQVLFAVDERSRSWDTGAFPKASITEANIRRLGLWAEDPIFAWVFGDYVLYAAADLLPQARFFWVVEDDVLIDRSDKVAFFRELDALSSSDLLGIRVRPAPENWFWRPVASAHYKDVFQCFFPLTRVSGRAVRFLHAERQRLGKLYREDPAENRPSLPNDESFVASALYHGGYTLQDINDFGPYYKAEHFAFGTLFNARCVPPGSVIYHSVASGAAYARRLERAEGVDVDAILTSVAADGDLALDDVRPVFLRHMLALIVAQRDEPASIFASLPDVSSLRPADRSAAIRTFADALAATGKEATLRALVNANGGELAGGPTLRLNLAFGKPADQSSTCVWSREQDMRRDAALTNNGDLRGEYGGHTDEEDRPWWQVDLEERREVTGFRIHNRRSLEGRLSGFHILVSDDTSRWTTIFEDPGDAGELSVISIDLDVPVMTRYVRVLVPRTTMLHMLEFIAFGSQIHGAGAAGP